MMWSMNLLAVERALNKVLQNSKQQKSPSRMKYSHNSARLSLGLYDKGLLS